MNINIIVLIKFYYSKSFDDSHLKCIKVGLALVCLNFWRGFGIIIENLVGLAQMVRASDCGPEGRRFNSDIPPHIKVASVVQRLVCKFSKLEMRFRLPPLAPDEVK